MARKGGNPDIVKVGKKTQIKKGETLERRPDIKTWSYRNQLQYIAGQPIDMSSQDAMNASLQRLLKQDNGKPCSAARAVAVRMLEKVLKKMEAPLSIALIENTEGKLTQVIETQKRVPAPTDSTDTEEAARIYIEQVKL